MGKEVNRSSVEEEGAENVEVVEATDEVRIVTQNGRNVLFKSVAYPRLSKVARK